MRIYRTTLVLLFLATILSGAVASPLPVNEDAGRRYPAFVSGAHDGDTFKATVDVGFNVFVNESFRMAGIDTPELPSKEGVAARDAFRDRVVGRQIVLVLLGQEKYGRWLAVVYVDGENINEWLVKSGYARPYAGGKR